MILEPWQLPSLITFFFLFFSLFVFAILLEWACVHNNVTNNTTYLSVFFPNKVSIVRTVPEHFVVILECV